ncbi:hypothetical protein HPB47_014337, partial [Ixodes persulcatus]
MQIAFSAVLPRRENRFCSLEWQRSHAAEIEALNDRHREVNSLLRELCRREGFTFLDGLADEWHQWIGRDGVHPSRMGNKVLAGFMGQQVRSILEKMARAKIQQDHKEAMPGTRSWDGWTIKGAPPIAPCELELPPLSTPGASAAPSACEDEPPTQRLMILSCLKSQA